jgi:hypothetical protein
MSPRLQVSPTDVLNLESSSSSVRWITLPADICIGSGTYSVSCWRFALLTLAKVVPGSTGVLDDEACCLARGPKSENEVSKRRPLGSYPILSSHIPSQKPSRSAPASRGQHWERMVDLSYRIDSRIQRKSGSLSRRHASLTVPRNLREYFRS